MRNRIITILIAIAACLGLTLSATPAMAYSSSSTETHCHDYGATGWVGRTVHVCMTVGWRTQDDGWGIRIEDVKFSGDCSELEGNGYQGFSNGVLFAWGDEWRNTGYLNCGQWYDVEIKADSTRVRVSGFVHVRIDNSPDVDAEWPGFDICQGNVC